MCAFRRIVFSILAATAPAAAEDNSTVVEREAPRIQAAGGAVERNGTKLVLHLTSGKTTEFTDGPSCHVDPPELKGQSCYGYELERYDRARAVFVVFLYFYEGGRSLIIDDRSGETTELQSEPHFSPQGDIALELTYGENHYYEGDPVMNIWRRAGGKFVRIWSHSFPDNQGGDGTRFTVLGWRSNDHIDINAYWAAVGETTRFSIERTTEGWRLIER
jgi:hypothetical protein